MSSHPWASPPRAEGAHSRQHSKGSVLPCGLPSCCKLAFTRCRKQYENIGGHRAPQLASLDTQTASHPLGRNHAWYRSICCVLSFSLDLCFVLATGGIAWLYLGLLLLLGLGPQLSDSFVISCVSEPALQLSSRICSIRAMAHVYEGNRHENIKQASSVLTYRLLDLLTHGHMSDRLLHRSGSQSFSRRVNLGSFSSLRIILPEGQARCPTILVRLSGWITSWRFAFIRLNT